MTWIDFDDLLSSGASKGGRKGYSGHDKKASVIYDKRRYMIKYSEKTDTGNDDLKTSYSNSPYSEYISCHIIGSIGMPVQKTLLGLYRGKTAVACEDFMQDFPASYQLQEFSYLENSFPEPITIDRTPYIGNVNAIFDRHPLLENFGDEARGRYWDVFVCDALTGNFDRHSGNWGYIVDLASEKIFNAPVYDCGSSLFPALAEEKMQEEMDNAEHMRNRLYVYPRAALLDEDKKKIIYHDYLLNSGNPDCDAALLRVVPKISLDAISEIINTAPGLSEVQKEFYNRVTCERYSHILMPAYEKIALYPEIYR